MLSRIHSFPAGNLRHPSHTSTSKSRVLVAIPPAVYSPLDKTTLASQARIQLSQCPTYRVAFSFVVKSVAFILIFGAAGSWVHAILRLEILWESIGVYRLNITANGILHLDTISRVLECNPLHTILVLPNDERCRRWNGTRRSVWINAWPSLLALVHARSWRSLWCPGLGTHLCWLPLKLSLLHLRARAPG